MRYEPREILLRDGTVCLLRSPMPSDAPVMLDYLKITAAETDFLLRYPEEVTLTTEDEQSFLQKNLESPTDSMIAAFVNGQLAGNAGVQCVSGRQKLRHRCSLGIALKQAFWHNGLGSLLMDAALEQAAAAGFEQIELNVYSANTRAIALYERKGFERWGTVRSAAKLKDGRYLDEYLMGRFLTAR